MNEVTNRSQRANNNREKENKPKRNYDLPAFVLSNGTIMTHAIGVNVPIVNDDKPEAKKAVLETALRIFKRKVLESGIIDEYKGRQEYIKKSARKRRQRLEAIRHATYNLGC